ncbi:MAG TPA: hypothetical protein VIA18_20205, partial [Polyangia bacterium]|nr:hypothetical protein [Polyangia bacterium]
MLAAVWARLGGGGEAVAKARRSRDLGDIHDRYGVGLELFDDELFDSSLVVGFAFLGVAPL